MAKKQGLAITAYDAREIVKKGKLVSELELERAVRADRLLRLMSKEHPDLEPLSKQISDLIIQYEAKHWSDSDLVTDDQIRESDLAEAQVEKERLFFRKRKELILKKLKEFDLNQNDLAAILAHSKSYTSELVSGTRSFSMNDLVIIHMLFNISFDRLICTNIPTDVQQRIDGALRRKSLGNSKTRGHSSVISIVKSLSGAVKVDKNFSEKEEYRKHLAKKYS